jgi:hypothetical protein
MKKLVTFLILTLLFFNLPSFSQNALDFDGVDDQIVITNASSVINTGTGISLGMWVYPRNAAPNFPDFDGFGGFRNDIDADFYLVQIGASTVEARFRNSSGNNFDITFNNLTLNTWQHLVFTYDGNAIKLYHNGIEVGSQAANGSIVNAFQSMYIGDIVYSFNDFLLDGKIDEVFLYNKALSLGEINCLQHGDIDTNDTSLMLYYGCNQGLAEGLNSGLNSLTNFDGQFNGTLYNFTLDGSNSNWVGGDIFAATEVASICIGESYSYQGNSYNTSGTYSFYYPLGNGCDSVSHLVLNVLAVDTSLSFASNTILIANGVASAYQWVQCDNNYSAITGANQSSFNVTANGDYACIITNGNCVDTSRCVTVIVTGLDNMEEINNLSVWPIPASNTLTLSGLNGLSYNIEIFDETGRQVLYTKVSTNNELISIDIASLESGIYYMQSIDLNKTKRILKFVVMGK